MIQIHKTFNPAHIDERKNQQLSNTSSLNLNALLLLNPSPSRQQKGCPGVIKHVKKKPPSDELRKAIPIAAIFPGLTASSLPTSQLVLSLPLSTRQTYKDNVHHHHSSQDEEDTKVHNDWKKCIKNYKNMLTTQRHKANNGGLGVEGRKK